MRMLVCLSFPAILLTAPAALAHGGHVGDLAGHSHWVGWAAAAAAAALAAWAAKRGAKSGTKTETDSEGEPVESDDRPDRAEA